MGASHLALAKSIYYKLDSYRSYLAWPRERTNDQRVATRLFTVPYISVRLSKASSHYSKCSISAILRKNRGI